MNHSVQKALHLLETGKISEALGEFSFVLEVDPDNIPALTGKARCLLNYIYDDRKLDDGTAIMKKLIIDLEYNKSPDILLLKAKFLWRKKHHNDALTQIDYIKNTWGSEYPELLYTEARILASNSIKRFKEALELSQKLSARERYFIQGRIAHLKGISAQTTEEKKKYHKDAISLFEKSFEIDFAVNDDSAVDNFIISCYHIGEEESLLEAIRVGKLFLEKNPDSYIADKTVKNIQRCFGLMYANTHDFEESSFVFEMKTSTTFNSQNRIKRKKIAKEFVDFAEEMQSKQNELFEPEQIDSVMIRILSPYDGKPYYYDDLGLHHEQITSLNEFWLYHKKLNENTLYSKIRESDYHFFFGLTYQHILQHKKALEYYNTYVDIIEEIIVDVLDDYQVAYYSNLVNVHQKILECCRILGKKEISTKTIELYSKKFERYLERGKELAAKLKIKNAQKNAPEPPPKYSGDEGERLELKSSFFMHGVPSDMNKQEKNAKEEKGFAEIAESVCAFLNTDGGEIIIGVDDDKNCLGIEADIQKTKKKTYDAYTKTVTDKISSLLNEKYPNFINFGCVYYPEDAPGDQLRLYRIFVDRLPNNEPYPATVTTGNSPPIVYYRTGDSDASYKYEDGIKEWDRRKNKIKNHS